MRFQWCRVMGEDDLAISLLGARLRKDKLLPREFGTRVRMDQPLWNDAKIGFSMAWGVAVLG